MMMIFFGDLSLFKHVSKWITNQHIVNYVIMLDFGHIPSPFDCYQVIRGIKTLPIRMRRHHYNSLEVAKFLMQDPKIEEVRHPGMNTVTIINYS